MGQQDIVDLISEQHGALRKACDTLWGEQGPVPITSSEWYVLSRIYGQEPTLAEVTKSVDISRQGVHKLLNGLQEKGVVARFRQAHNKRDTYVSLTPFGSACYEQYMQIKQQLQQRIAGVIGEEGMAYMLALFQKDWLGVGGAEAASTPQKKQEPVGSC